MNKALYAAELALAAGCLGRFAWGMSRGFVRPTGWTPRMAVAASWGVFTATCTLVALLWFNPLRTGPALVGMPLFAMAWALFEWATWVTRGRRLTFAFVGDVPAHLLTAGPFRLVRHPYYAAFLLAWVAGIVTTGEGWLVLPLVVMFGFYNAAANHEEAKFAASPLAADYAAYRARTGKYLPRWPRRQAVAGV
jgi:protein-S-isoprenylcysteine O-methyltransferase Ste14